jgi:hypothetical protein
VGDWRADCDLPAGEELFVLDPRATEPCLQAKVPEPQLRK